jgi:hypothetical protein
LQDELVPPVHMHSLYEKTIEHNNDCLFVDFPDGMHMDTWYSGGDRYWRTIQLFLQRFTPDGTSPSLSLPHPKNKKQNKKKRSPMFNKFVCSNETKV